MDEQLRLPEIESPDGDRGAHRRHDWYLDEETRERGRKGVAAARAALHRARREAGRAHDRAA